MKQHLLSAPSRLSTLVYLIAALFAIGYAGWHYLMGHYTQILLPAITALLLIAVTLVRPANQHFQHLAAYVLVSAGYLLLAVELQHSEHSGVLWLGLPPVLALLLLPLSAALTLNLLLAPLWLLLINIDMSLAQTALIYLTLVVLCALVPLEQLRQSALLSATASYSPLCQALSTHALEESLESELDRARILQRRLSVLVIHLSQLEMANEQFGSRLYRLMLQRFCQVAHQNCRSHDSLGYTGNGLFWLVLPDTGDNGALMVRNRLLIALESCIFAETGPLAARIAICIPLPAEHWPAFEQRLVQRGHALMASNS